MSSTTRSPTRPPEASSSARSGWSLRCCSMRHSSAAVANVIEFPVRREDDGQLEYDLVYALATADDLAAGMADAVDSIRSGSGAAGVEWWARGEDGALEL